MLGIETLAKVWPQADGTGDREMVILNDGLIPNVRVVRVAISTGYNTGQGNQRGSRNGLVNDLPPQSTVTIRLLFFIAVRVSHSPEWVDPNCTALSLITSLMVKW